MRRRRGKGSVADDEVSCWEGGLILKKSGKKEFQRDGPHSATGLFWPAAFTLGLERESRGVEECG